MVFHEMRYFAQLCAEKLMKTPKQDSLLEKWQVLAKSMTFHGFSRNEVLITNFCRNQIILAPVLYYSRASCGRSPARGKRWLSGGDAFVNLLNPWAYFLGWLISCFQLSIRALTYNFMIFVASHLIWSWSESEPLSHHEVVFSLL